MSLINLYAGTYHSSIVVFKASTDIEVRSHPTMLYSGYNRDAHDFIEYGTKKPAGQPCQDQIRKFRYLCHLTRYGLHVMVFQQIEEY